MKTSQEWWDEVKASPEKLNDWLVKQYRGEVTASHRILRFAEQFATNPSDIRILKVIADQESQHAEWIFDLLSKRNIEVDPEEINQAEKRYWKETLPSIDSFEKGAAVAAHAEGMRLERIRVIANDPDAPLDIKHTFMMILTDEVFHEKAFTKLSNAEALLATQSQHELGLQALGLAA